MTTHALHDESHHDDVSSKVIFGFWIYIMTDAILFAALFATYAVLHNNIWNGPGIQQIATMPYVMVQSLVLLTSVFTYGLSSVALHRGHKKGIFFWLAITFLLGLVFLGFEWQQFANLLQHGNSWQTSAFLSIFFSLVGIHGFHIVAGLLWIIILMVQLKMQSITPTMQTRLTCLGLFWNFLNIMWLFIFTIVYLMGAI